MPIQVDVRNGSVSGGSLTYGCNFEWVNATSNQVSLTCCGSFCTQTNYTVPAAANGQPGITGAQMLSAPQFIFGDSAWSAPGSPHIVVNPEPVAVDDIEDDEPEAADRDVA
jgi:hypothetical protein